MSSYDIFPKALYFYMSDLGPLEVGSCVFCEVKDPVLSSPIWII